VETYASGPDFLGSLKNGFPDIVVLDLHMPGLSGFEVQGAINALVRTVPVIVITGHDSPETRQRVLDGRAAAYLRKPIDEQLLIHAICEATGSAQPS
jgi:CheY-like chemotaxis protein